MIFLIDHNSEATFFLKNCPNVKMDGNNDGIPCEQQWCK
ncbi:MAG: excalibur calcium-binding domain-containing protein [Pseudanabaena sp.]|nr:excalibur calcium-binding domain-containing protein [Pseudanabaena sp. 42896M_M3]